MNHAEMISYIKKFNDRPYNSLTEVKEAVKKLERLLAKFGYKFESSFGARCRPSFSDSSSAFYRLQLAEYEYHEIQLGYLEDKVYTGKSKGKKHYLTGYKGLCRLDLNHKVSLNPETGRPWQIGDTKTSADGCYSVTLTKRGWYSGD